MSRESTNRFYPFTPFTFAFRFGSDTAITGRSEFLPFGPPKFLMSKQCTSSPKSPLILTSYVSPIRSCSSGATHGYGRTLLRRVYMMSTPFFIQRRNRSPECSTPPPTHQFRRRDSRSGLFPQFQIGNFLAPPPPPPPSSSQVPYS